MMYGFISGVQNSAVFLFILILFIYEYDHIHATTSKLYQTDRRFVNMVKALRKISLTVNIQSTV